MQHIMALKKLAVAAVDFDFNFPVPHSFCYKAAWLLLQTKNVRYHQTLDIIAVYCHTGISTQFIEAIKTAKRILTKCNL